MNMFISRFIMMFLSFPVYTSEKPILMPPLDWIGSTLIFCNWTTVACFPDTTYRCRCTRASDNDVIFNNTTDETEFMFYELDPNTTYRVEIFLDGTKSSTPSSMKLTTFG